jgi:hypothetical protein
VFGCTKSPSGSVEELIKTRTPTFGGQTTAFFRTPSTTYQLNGECDPIGYALVWSLNEHSWSDVPGGCSNGAFSITVGVIRQVKVYVRSKTKTGFTPSGVATVRLQLPPTSPVMSFVSAGNADDDLQLGTQFGMDSVTKATMNNGTVTVKPSLIDTIYDH